MKNLQQVLNTYRTIVIFVLLATILTIIFGAIYGTGYLVLRGDSNDPQIEVTRQVEDIIDQGVPLDAIVNSEEAIDLSESMSLFVSIFDKDSKLVSSTVKVDGESPTPNWDAFAKARETGEHRFDWEPKEGLRAAAVMKSVGENGFVLAGKSLNETDKRLETLALCTSIGWAVSILLAAVLTIAIKPRQSLAIIEETNVTVVESSNE